MAVSATSSPSGFSYAQAAKGRASNSASQLPSKVNSGASTPAAASIAATLPESNSTGNWAEDVELASASKSETAPTSQEEQVAVAPPKDSAVERTKSDSRVPNGVSGGSSPELAASSITDKTDDSSATNGVASDATSASTWETKSQASEGNWIADREKRQQSANRSADSSDKASTVKGGKSRGKESKEAAPAQPAPPPVVLTDAPAPAVNPWAKRAEEAKARSLSKPVTAEATADSARARPESSRRNPAEASRDVTQADGRRSQDGKRFSESRINNTRQAARPHPESARPEPHAGRPAQREHQSLPNLNVAAPPPPTKDEISWPTPDAAQQEEHKDASAEKDSKETNEGADAEANGAAKRHEKTKWTVIPVTPTIKWETEEMNRPPRSERGRGGGSGARGRGGFRGAPNGYKDGGRPTRGVAHNDVDGADAVGPSDSVPVAEGQDRDTMPPPPRPAQASSRSQSSGDRRAHSRPAAPKGNSDRPTALTETKTESPRAISPGNAEAAATNGTSDGKVAQPLTNGDDAASAVRDTVANGESNGRRVTSDARREPRSFDNYGSNKEWNGSTRGSKRGGRGRGGSREFASGHQANQAYTNGNGEFAHQGQFSVPPSPGSYQGPRGGYNGFAQNRGSWRAGPRGQSIPVEGAFSPNRFAQYGHPGQPAPLQTAAYPNMYDPALYGMPMSAVPYTPMMEPQFTLGLVQTQLDYYFSMDNLLKDIFLRKQMDSQGFVLFDVIVNFNAVKQRSQDRDLIKTACLKSDSIEIRVGEDGKERLRRREGWQQFVLPMDQRVPDAQNEGPQTLHRPEVPQLQTMWPMHPSMQYRGPPSADPYSATAPRRPTFESQHSMNNAAPPFSPYAPTGPQDAVLFGEDAEEASRGRSTRSPTNGSDAAPVQHTGESQNTEPDAFPDHKIGELNVIYKLNPQTGRSAYHASSSRTFSNGSLDTVNIAAEMEKLLEKPEQPLTNGDSAINGDFESHKANGDNAEDIPLWLKNQEFQQEDIPAGTHVQPYFALRKEAFSQRERAPLGSCPHDLDILYKFWSHFLIRNFNNRMYGEFRFYALDDAKSRENVVGLQHLVNFYVNALKSPSHIVRDGVVVDYLELVKDQPANLANYAFKQLRQTWRDGATNLKNRKKLTSFMEEPLKSQLEQ